MELDSAAPTEALLSPDGCQIIVVEGDVLVRDILLDEWMDGWEAG